METHLVVGMFDDMARAREAVDRLVTWGFTRDNVHLTSKDSMMPDRAAAPAEAQAQHARIGEAVSRLCGDAASGEEAACYAETVRRGSVMVTVTSGSDEGADSAADIMNECGAVDLEVHERYLRDAGWQGAAATSGARRPARSKHGVRIYSRTGSG